MPYAIYLRKSRADLEAEARGEGETLARHQAQLLELSKKLSLDVGAVYKELVSGETIASRPVMQQLLEEVSSGMWEGVICMEIERLARGDTMDQGLVSQAFKFSETKIITPSKTYDPNNEFDEEYFEFSLFMSRREYKTIRRRMQAGRMASVREGNYIGSLPPYGYRKIRNYEEKAFTLEPIPEEAETVRLMYDLYINKDMGYNKIATYLNNLGIPPKRIDSWSSSSVKDIIENPIYCGKLRWNWRKTKNILMNGKVIKSRPKSDGVIYQGKHPPIVSEEMWQKAQDVPSKAPHTAGHFDGPVKNPFVGLLTCEMCGHAMVRRPYGDRPPYYICVHKGCKCMSSSEPEIVTAIISALEKQYQIYYVMSKDPNKTQVKKVDVEKNIKAELEKIKKQQERLYDLLEQGIYTTEVFTERSAVISARRKELEAMADKAMRDRKIHITPAEACVALKNVIDNYNKLDDPTEKNKLLKTVVKRINYKKTVGGRYHQSDMEIYMEYVF